MKNRNSSLLLGWLNAGLFSLLIGSKFLLYHLYPLHVPESLLFMALFFLVLAIPMILAHFFRASWLFYLVLLILFFDLSFGFLGRIFWRNLLFKVDPSHLGTNPSGVLDYIYPLLAVIALTAITFALRQRIAKYASVVFACMLVGTLLQSVLTPANFYLLEKSEKQQTKPDLPNIFIFILDGHLGIDGIPNLSPKAYEIKKDLVERYTEKGFQVYPKSYSNYFETVDSLSTIFNASHKPLHSENRLLKMFQDQDYALNIYQSDYFQFCQLLKGKTSLCFEYHPNSIRYLSKVSMPVGDKLRLMIYSFVDAHGSELLRKMHRLIGRLGIWAPAFDVRTELDEDILGQLEEDLDSNEKGTVFITHLLLPHDPYMYDSQCQIKPLREWDFREPSTGEIWKRKNSRYLDQMECLHRRLDQFFAVLEEKKLFEDAAIVLFGDHGSRLISKTDPGHEDAAALTAQEYVAIFSSFLAMKKPLQKGPGVLVEKKTAIADAVRHFFKLEPAPGTSEEDLQKIYLKTGKVHEFEAHDMPDF